MNHKSFRINLKRNYSTRSSITWRGSIIGDWLEPFVFTVSSKSLRRTAVLTYSSNFRRSFARGSRSILDLSPLRASFHPPLSFSPLSLPRKPRSLISTRRFPSFFPLASPRWYIFPTLASISRHFITIKRAHHALSPCRIMAIHQRVVLPASIAIQIGANPRWLSSFPMTLKSWRGCSIFRTFDRGVIKACHAWLQAIIRNPLRFCFINLNVQACYYDILGNIK